MLVFLDVFYIWLFDKKNKTFIAFALHMRSYDGYFIMNYIVSKFNLAKNYLKLYLTVVNY
jgi:hypothetical protein